MLFLAKALGFRILDIKVFYFLGTFFWSKCLGFRVRDRVRIIELRLG